MTMRLRPGEIDLPPSRPLGYDAAAVEAQLLAVLPRLLGADAERASRILRYLGAGHPITADNRRWLAGQGIVL